MTDQGGGPRPPASAGSGAGGAGAAGSGAAGAGSAPTRARRLRREAWGFMIGSACFFVGALPWFVDAVGSVAANATFFVGSLFFTAAAFIQLGLSGRRFPHARMSPADRTDWSAAAVQFAGTLLFNLSTAAALAAAVAADDGRSARTGDGWVPDAWGSVAFLVSSALALVATKDRGELWDRDARTWHGSTLNMVGSVAFAVSAVGAFLVPATGEAVDERWANAGTAIGALCFFVAAILSRRGS